MAGGTNELGVQLTFPNEAKPAVQKLLKVCDLRLREAHVSSLTVEIVHPSVIPSLCVPDENYEAGGEIPERESAPWR
jgi:hypothetical protein